MSALSIHFSTEGRLIVLDKDQPNYTGLSAQLVIQTAHWVVDLENI